MRRNLGSAPLLDDDTATKKYVDDEIAGVVLDAGVQGPGSSVNNAIVRWDGTAGTTVQSSGVTISDTDDLDVPGDITADNLSGTNTGDQDLSGLVPNTRTVNGHALSSNVTVTKADVGLGNADNTADTAKPISTATQTALDDKADLVGGVVPTSQIPAMAYTDVSVVANQAAMLALTGIQEGDLAVRSDGAGTFILTDADPSVLANWVLLNAPTDVVVSVNGQTGTVVLAKGDVGLGNVTNTSDANKPVSTAQQTALDLKANIASPTFTGTVSGITKAMVGLGNVDNTSNATERAAVKTLTNTTLDVPKINDIYDANGNQILRLPPVTSAVNCYYITNQSAGNYPTIGVDGSDTDIGMAVVPKNAGPFRIIGQGSNHPTIQGLRDAGNGNLNLTTDGTGKVQANGNDVVTTNAVPLGNATGNLAVARLNGGTNANQYTYWRGDGAWAPVTLTPAATSNTTTTDEGKYTAVVTVTLTGQFQTTFTTGSFGDVSGGPGGYAHGEFSMWVRQEALMTNDPLVDLRMTNFSRFDNTDLVAVCTTKTGGSTVVTLYAKMDTEYEGWFILPGILDTAKVSFLSSQPWLASPAAGTQYAATYELTTTGTPTDPQHATTKAYVDAAVAAATPTETLTDLGVVGTSQVLNIASATQFYAALTPNTTCVFTLPALRAAASFMVYVRQPAAGGGNGAALFPGVAWQAGIAPTVTPLPGREDVFVFTCDGRNWLGSVTQNYVVEDPTVGARTAVVPLNVGKRWGARGVRTLGQVVRRGRN